MILRVNKALPFSEILLKISMDVLNEEVGESNPSHDAGMVIGMKVILTLVIGALPELLMVILGKRFWPMLSLMLIESWESMICGEITMLRLIS